METQSTLFEQKGIEGLPFVQPRIVYPEVNDLSFEACQDLVKEFEETTGIAFCWISSDHESRPEDQPIQRGSVAFGAGCGCPRRFGCLS